MKRREFSRAVKAEIMARCHVATGWQCELCRTIVASGEVDHVIAEALCIDKSIKLTAKDGAFLCWPCHQGPDGKTPKDKAAIGKAKRVEAKYLGTKPPSSSKIAARVKDAMPPLDKLPMPKRRAMFK